MRPRLPPLNALKAFEAAARHENFTRAAEELCVTQGAVSHQVKALETELAIKLFNRERQRLIITEAGRDYLAVVRDALDRIGAGTERLLKRQSAGVLTVSTSPDLPQSGWCTGSATLPKPTPASICVFPQRCITWTSRGRRSISRCAMATAIGRDSTR
ncbi:LysR family transcriptional regulator [Bradyrhizobium sp. ARR65]|uniref:LysR family transcriptional regulator n=1 Tax=Bradyrhizobium sp. ARR65 TaxID=1040989 RepID=UPI001FD9E4FE|nr:LysR family transcriptional regulator [Bradyrhizobium sp. ARR65]